jgi:isoleucyl-tRNA synthetase
LIQKTGGIDFWWSSDYDKELLDTLPNKSGDLSRYEKSTDIFDIWFDSGSTFNSVVKSQQADLYCEGVDQFTGWFQSSLLLGVALNNQSPYKKLLVHGFVVDENNRKMSKSVGNVIEPAQAIYGVKNKMPQSGLDALRFWVAHEYNKSNIQIGPAILDKFIKRVFDLRSVFRFVVGNLNDFSGLERDLIDYELLNPVDKFILCKLSALIDPVVDNYNSMNLNRSINLIENFVLTHLSSFYIKSAKDRLYCDKADSLQRRSAQTALYYVLVKLLPTIAPILPHLAEEAFLNSPMIKEKSTSSLFRSELSMHGDSRWKNESIDGLFDVVNFLRDRFNERIKTDNAATFDLTIQCDESLFKLLTAESSSSWLGDCFGCASLKCEVLANTVSLTEFDSTGIKFLYRIEVDKCKDKFSCPRCRRFIADEEHGLCVRCAGLVNS